MSLVSGFICDHCGNAAMWNGHIGKIDLIDIARGAGWSASVNKAKEIRILCPNCRRAKPQKKGGQENAGSC